MYFIGVSPISFIIMAIVFPLVSYCWIILPLRKYCRFPSKLLNFFNHYTRAKSDRHLSSSRFSPNHSSLIAVVSTCFPLTMASLIFFNITTALQLRSTNITSILNQYFLFSFSLDFSSPVSNSSIIYFLSHLN